MSAAVAAILEGMPEPRDLRMHQHDGRCVITAGPVVLFDYAAGDIVMRNIALTVLRQLGFGGRAVAAALGLSEAYVATLHSAARRDGTAALAMQDRRGTPGKVTAAQWEQARAWREQGASDAEIGRRLGVANTTVGRGLGPRGQAPAPGGQAGQAPADPLFSEPEPEPGAAPDPDPDPDPGAGAGAGLPPGGGPSAWPLPAEGVLWSRYAGAMLLHAFLARAGAGTILAAAAGGPGDAALLSAVSMCFALGAATTEQFKHLAAAEAGPLAGLGALPGLRALRPELARIADRTDPLALQQLFASAMLAADPVTSGCTTSMTTSWSLSNSVCKLGQSLSFCYITNITAGSFRRQGQTGTRSGNVTANAFMAAFQPSVPVPRCPLSRTSPSPSMWRPVTFLIPR